MDTIIKISADFETFTAQFTNVDSLEYQEELADTGFLKFTLPISDPQLDAVFEFQKVSLYTPSGFDDILLWTGFISRIEYGINQVSIECGDGKKFLRKKIIYADKTFTGVTIDSILNTLVTESNSRSGENMTYTTDLTSTVTKDFIKGAKYYDILTEIALLLNAEWKVEKEEIIFKSTIGEDKSTGVNFTELISSKENPNETNLESLLITRSTDELYTSVIGKDNTTYSEKNASTIYGRLETLESFSDGDLSTQTQAFLDEHKISQQEITVEVAEVSIDFQDVNIGDVLQLRIEQGITYIDITEDVIVLSKTVKFTNGTPVLDLKVGTAKKQIESASNYFGNIQQRLDKLEL